MSACTGCGLCCLSQRCGAAVAVAGELDAICPFLEYIQDRYICKLVATEAMSDLEPILAEALGIGSGCPNEADRGMF
jgi:hypothetical protein